MLLWATAQGFQPFLPQVANGLLGNILWYYSSGGPYAPLVPFPDMSVKCEAIRGTGLVRVRGFARTPERAPAQAAT